MGSEPLAVSARIVARDRPAATPHFGSLTSSAGSRDGEVNSPGWRCLGFFDRCRCRGPPRADRRAAPERSRNDTLYFVLPPKGAQGRARWPGDAGAIRFSWSARRHRPAPSSRAAARRGCVDAAPLRCGVVGVFDTRSPRAARWWIKGGGGLIVAAGAACGTVHASSLLRPVRARERLTTAAWPSGVVARPPFVLRSARARLGARGRDSPIPPVNGSGRNPVPFDDGTPRWSSDPPDWVLVLCCGALDRYGRFPLRRILRFSVGDAALLGYEPARLAYDGRNGSRPPLNAPVAHAGRVLVRPAETPGSCGVVHEPGSTIC